MIKINADNGRILVSARSGYGKTYLVKALLKDALKQGWKVRILSYTEKKEANYWNELKKAGADITFTDSTDEKTLIDFLTDTEGNEVVYVDDLDLYISYDTKTGTKLLKDYMSACRKANVILIFSLKDMKEEFYDLLKLSSILFIGKFMTHLGVLDRLNFENIREKEESLNDAKHEFLMLNLDDNSINFVRVDENENIVFTR